MSSDPPMTSFPIFHLPPGGRNPNFTGREVMLADNADDLPPRTYPH